MCVYVRTYLNFNFMFTCMCVYLCMHECRYLGCQELELQAVVSHLISVGN